MTEWTDYALCIERFLGCTHTSLHACLLSRLCPVLMRLPQTAHERVSYPVLFALSLAQRPAVQSHAGQPSKGAESKALNEHMFGCPLQHMSSAQAAHHPPACKACAARAPATWATVQGWAVQV